MSRLLKEDAESLSQAYKQILSEALYGPEAEGGKAMPWKQGTKPEPTGPYDLNDFKELFSGKYAEEGKVADFTGASDQAK